MYKVGLVVFITKTEADVSVCPAQNQYHKGKASSTCTYGVYVCHAIDRCGFSLLSISIVIGCNLRLVLYINTQHWVHRVLRYFQYHHQCTCTCITDGCTVCNVCVCIKKIPAVVVLVRRVGCFLLFPFKVKPVDNGYHWAD